MTTVYNIASTDSTTSSTDSTKSSSTTLDKDAFLQLMVAQMQNQDPLSPMDNSQMVAQLATFSTLEQLTNMASDIEGISDNISILNDNVIFQNNLSLLTQGAALIGKQVTYTDSDGKEASGTVTSVKMADEAVSLVIGDTEVSLDDVLEVK